MKKTTGPSLNFHKGEKLIIAIICIFAILTPMFTVYLSANLSSSKVEVEKLKEKIQEQENVNSSLSMQVDELASLSNIQSIAKDCGLSYNNDNIIVIK